MIQYSGPYNWSLSGAQPAHGLGRFITYDELLSYGKNRAGLAQANANAVSPLVYLFSGVVIGVVGILATQVIVGRNS